MKKTVLEEQVISTEDEFWSERLPFFTAQLPSYFRKPQQVHGRFHTSDEHYTPWRREIIPLSARKGERTYIMMQPYVLQPELTFTVGFYDQPNTTRIRQVPLVK